MNVVDGALAIALNADVIYFSPGGQIDGSGAWQEDENIDQAE